MEPVKNEHFFLSSLFKEIYDKKDFLKEEYKLKDSAEISNTAKVFDKLDKFLNLGRTNRLDIDDLNDKEKEEFLKMLSELLKRGIVGYEILEVNGKPEKHYIVNQIGDERIYGAKLYKKRGYYKD
ncbi:MAG: hypothetical protein WHS65_06140 [Melioribacteraceae bacterium]